MYIVSPVVSVDGVPFEGYVVRCGNVITDIFKDSRDAHQVADRLNEAEEAVSKYEHIWFDDFDF